MHFWPTLSSLTDSAAKKTAYTIFAYPDNSWLDILFLRKFSEINILAVVR